MAVNQSFCSKCGTGLSAGDSFCPSCALKVDCGPVHAGQPPRQAVDSVSGGTVPQQPGAARDEHSVPKTIRGRILRDTNAGPGLISVGGNQLAFTLENHWKSDIAPAVQMTVDVRLDADGKVVLVAPVSEKDLAAEKIADASENAKKAFKEHWPTVLAYADIIGKPTLISVALLFIAWNWLSLVNIQIMATMSRGATMFDVLSMLNTANALQAFESSSKSGSGLYGLLCTVAIFAPLVPTFVKHRYAYLSYFAPLGFLLLVVAGIYFKLHQATNFANQAMGATGSNQFADQMRKQMMQAMMDSISIGFGAYLSLVIVVYLAYYGMTKVSSHR